MQASVKLLLTEIKYEVKFDTWLKEKIVNEEQKNSNANHKTVDYAYKNDKAEDWLVRKIQDAVDKVYGELRWCVLDNSSLHSDEILVNPTKWEIFFDFSSAWCGSIRALNADIHRYVCEYVLSQWYRIAKPDVYNAYAISAEEYLRMAYNEARSEKVSLEPWQL